MIAQQREALRRTLRRHCGGESRRRAGPGGKLLGVTPKAKPVALRLQCGNQEVVSAGSETPFAFEVMSPAVEGKLQAKTSGEASKPPSFSSFDFAADEFQ